MSLRPSSWITVRAAAAFLGVPVVSLRRTIQRQARPTPDGGTVSRLDGITARKLGRLWRIWLDANWTDPTDGAR